MNIREALKSERSKEQMMRIQAYIGDDKTRFSELMEIFLNDTPKMMEYAGWALSHCADAHPGLVMPYVKYLVPHARNAPHVAIVRNIVRVLQFCPLERDDEGPVYDLCWDLAESTKEDIAVRANALSVLARIAESYPDLASEVYALAQGFQQFESAGLKSRGKRVARQMEEIIDAKNN
jgi:hypothetical protein